MPETAGASKVLIIDDEETTRYVFSRILSRAGHAIDTAATGAEGLEKAEAQPDVIIVDVNLPDMLGYDVCRRLRSNPLTATIPILQTSAAFTSNESQVQSLQWGADSYLPQPAEPSVLVAQVNALLRLRRAEMQSHTTALQWQATFDSLSEGLALADAAGVVVRMNATFLNTFGLVASERPLDAIVSSLFGVTLDSLLPSANGGMPHELAYKNRWFRVRYDVIQSGPGMIAGSILVAADITNEKKLQETLKLSEQLAATGRLAHIIAHEINNPLEALSNLLYLAAQEQSEPHEAKEYVRQASSELERVSHITKQVLAYNRESARPAMTDARNLLESSLAVFAQQMRDKHIVLQQRAGKPVEILVHPGEMRQVFSNLIANGLDAMDEGGTLRVRYVLCTRYPDRVRGIRFVFSDTGTGIPAEVLPRIFEPFYTTKDARGSGIGLWLSLDVLAKHRGHMRVRTRTDGPYRGTLFDVFLPLT